MCFCMKNMCACMEKPTGGKTPGKRRGTIPCSQTEVNILRHPCRDKRGVPFMLNNPGEYSAASYFIDIQHLIPSGQVPDSTTASTLKD